MPQIGWIDALRRWNLGGTSWCIPRKGTPGYETVMKIRRGEEAKTPKEIMDELERKTTGKPKSAKRILRVMLEPEPAPQMEAKVEIPTAEKPKRRTVKAKVPVEKMEEPKKAASKKESDELRSMLKEMDKLDAKKDIRRIRLGPPNETEEHKAARLKMRDDMIARIAEIKKTLHTSKYQDMIQPELDAVKAKLESMKQEYEKLKAHADELRTARPYDQAKAELAAADRNNLGRKIDEEERYKVRLEEAKRPKKKE